MKNTKKVHSKLANFNDPKWAYSQLVEYARKYREKLSTMKKSASGPKKLDIIAMEHRLYAYNSICRDALIQRLGTVQHFLYKK